MRHLLYLVLSGLILASCTDKEAFKPIDTGNKSDWNTSGQVENSKDEIRLTGVDAKAATRKSYKNFVLELECKTSPGAIGALLFHSGGTDHPNNGYEILINNNEKPAEWRKSGSLSAVRNFAKCVACNDEWTPIQVEVTGKQIKVFVNNLFVTDYTEPAEPYREPDYAERILSKGVFMLANYSNYPIAFRNIRVKALSDKLINESTAIDETHDDIIRLQQKNFPTIDYHLHLKGGWTKEQAAAQSRKYGITYGIAPNCGKNFPITDDQGIMLWLDTMKQQPFLMPMQAEGREWLEMFSKEAIDKFDYRFTDAMTWTDHKGRRMRLWIPEETFIDNKQQFMDMLVEKACGIISNEPVNIYVNPTFIPDQLMPEYNQLWTEKRMQSIIDACVKSHVAIEINNRYRIPSPAFIQLAKASGAKFTFGTNNTSPEDVGKLEYAIEMIKACNLQPGDMFIPTSKNR